MNGRNPQHKRMVLNLQSLADYSGQMLYYKALYWNLA